MLGLVALVLGAAACPSSSPPPIQPQEADPLPKGLVLGYGTVGAPLYQELELELTHTALGQFIEAKLDVGATLTPMVEGDALRVKWALQDVGTLDLDGVFAEGEAEQMRGLLTDYGKGISVADLHGVVDVDATDATPFNVARATQLADLKGPANQLLLAAVFAEIGLPRLPPVPLLLDEAVEFEEESETVITDSGLVLPTTTLHRFTLRDAQEDGVVQIAIALVSVAESDAPDPEADAAVEQEGPAIRVEIEAEGRLLFDTQAGIPVSLELNRTELFQIGEQEVERSLFVRSRYRVH